MDIPCWRVLEDNIFQQNILTIHQTNHYGAQETLDGIPFLFCLRTWHVHVGMLLGIGISLVGHPIAFFRFNTTWACQHFLPLGICYLGLFYRAPKLSVTINNALSGNSNVFGTISRKWRLASTCIQSLKRGFDDRVEILVCRELDHSSHLQVQVDVRLECDGTSKPYATWNHQSAASFCTKGLDGFGKSICTQCRTIAYSTKIFQINLILRKYRCFHFLHLKRQVLSVLLVGILSLATLLRLSRHCER